MDEAGGVTLDLPDAGANRSAMNVTVTRGAEILAAVWRFATWSDVGLLQGWETVLRADSSLDMRDSADFARQATMRWRGYADKSLAASSLEDVSSRNHVRPDEEFAVLLVLTADDWFRPQEPMAFAYIRRTWCRGFYLEFMGSHPLADGRIRGFIRATMFGLLSLAKASSAEWVWWEATADSYKKYHKILGAGNALGTLQPPVKDVFMIRTATLENLLMPAAETK